MTMMKSLMRRVWGRLALLDAVVIFLSLWIGNGWLLNTQMAFALSSLITLATFFSYKQLVERRVEAGAYEQESDVLKKYEDPYDLYDEEEEAMEPMVPGPVKAEPKIGFKESFKNLVNSYKGALSPYRLASYGMLFIGVLFLMRHDALNPIAFFVGLSIVPLGSLFLGNRGLQ